MAISADSRYTTAVIQTVEAPDGPRQEMRVPFPRARQISFTYHRVVEGERIDVIASKYFGNGRLWWMIAEANPEIINWLDLPAGEIIRVPNA